MREEYKNKNSIQFYQSKCDYFKRFTADSVLIASMGSILYFVSDCQLFGRFAGETLLPRLAILLPLALYILYNKHLKSYQSFSVCSYILLHLIMLNTTWAILYLPDKSHASEGYIVIQIAFFAVGFCAPFYMSTISHLLFIAEIFLSHQINHFDNFQLMLSLGIPVALCTILAQYAMQRLFSIHYKATRDLESATMTDVLTGTGNRRAFYTRAEKLIDQRETFSIAFIDIDRLKKCNDLYGHSAGDDYIQVVCDCLKQICEPGEDVYRIGGDEFILLSTISDASELADKITYARQRLLRDNQADKPYIAGISFGCVDSKSDEHRSVSELLSSSDRVMYQYKIIHYIGQKHGELNYSVSEEDGSLDKSGLDHRIFDVFANTSDRRYIYICNMDTNMSRWSAQAVRDFGLPGEYMYNAGDIWAEFVHPDDRQAYIDDINAVFSGQKAFHDIEYRAKTKDGNYVRCSCEGCILRGESENEADLFAGTITNLGIVDYLDPVTDCLNIYELLQYFQYLKANSEKAIIMIIGISQYGDINNSYGYLYGDRALKEFAGKIRGLLHSDEKIFRLDGVKFAITMPLSRISTINKLFLDMKEIASNQIWIEGSHISMDLFGAAIQLKKFSMEETTVLTEVLHVFSLAKKSRAGVLHLYDQNKEMELSKMMSLMDSLKECIRRQCKGFFLLYQPLVDQRGRVVGVESLLRWRNGQGEVVPPSEYISRLENETVFYQLGLWILRTALRQTKPFLTEYENFVVSVNVSYTQIDNYNFRKDVIHILKEEDFPAKNLVLELTEHCQTMNVNVLQRHMNFFHNHGIRIAADDFGTGYSSYSLMKQLPFDYIKIDQSFVSAMKSQKADQMIVESMTRIAKHFDMKVCIEGIESEELMEIIRSIQPDYYQGYYFSKPLHIDELEGMLYERNKLLS